MKKNYATKFSSRLAKYGSLSIALAGVSEINGQIVYTDIADFNGAGNSIVGIDLNNDATTDFFLATTITSTSGVYSNWLVVSPGSATGALLGLSSNSFQYPFALNVNDPIVPTPSTGSWVSNAGFQTLNYNGCIYTNSNWCNVTDRYLGLRFNIGTDVHYGWARLDVSEFPANGWVLKDFAYNTTPNEGLLAGQQTLSLDSPELNNVKIVALNKSIGIYNLPTESEYFIYSMTGKTVLNGDLSNSTESIEANTLSSGIYIFELKLKGSSSSIKKKIII